MAKALESHPDFNSKYLDNPDPFNQQLAYEKIFSEITLRKRKDDLEFYKLFAGDTAFKTALMQSVQRIIGTSPR